MTPLHLEARLPDRHWNNARFSAFEKELQTRVSHVCHPTIGADYTPRIRKTLEGLVPPAPALEYLSLSRPGEPWLGLYVPDTSFDGTTPRLSCLELFNCDISWQPPLLRNLKSLKLRTPSERPSLADWMDALNEMPQLKRLVLQSASPSTPPFPFYLMRTITLPSLTHFISPTLRGIVRLHFLISFYRLSPGCASWQRLIVLTKATRKESLRISRHTPTAPRTPSLCRACSSASKRTTQTSSRGLNPISMSMCATRTPCAPRRTLHEWYHYQERRIALCASDRQRGDGSPPPG
jgi:hypothetical protein